MATKVFWERIGRSNSSLYAISFETSMSKQYSTHATVIQPTPDLRFIIMRWISILLNLPYSGCEELPLRLCNLCGGGPRCLGPAERPLQA